MAIHEAQVEVTCDGKGCKSNTFVQLHATARGGYSASDSEIERDLEDQGWIVKDGQHFCSGECAGGQ